MKALLLAVALAAVAAPSVAHAQPAFALGHPLEAPDFEVGEISVRVIAGTIAKPVIGTDVTLLVNGTPRVVRTDSAGRAFFKELAPGATVQAQIKDEDGKAVESDAFQVPESGGMHVMLSTRAVDPSAGGGAPFAGGGGGGGGGPMMGGAGMPDPRKISGVARPEQKNPPGSLSVRVMYDSMTDKIPNIPVSLAAYGSTGSLDVVTKQTDAEGRAVFTGLDVSGATAYYAMAQMPRNGKLDRLVSAPIVLPEQTGLALLLSAEKQDSTAPPVDDQGRLDAQDPELPGGAVAITLEGGINQMNPITLVDVHTHTIVGHVMADHFKPDPTAIQAGAEPQLRPDEKPGTFDIAVVGGPGTASKPLTGIAIKVYNNDDTEQKTPFPGTTNDSGLAHFELAPGAYHAIITVNGKALTSQGLDLSTGGALLNVSAQWEAVGRLRALFSDIPSNPGQTLCGELVGSDGKTYVSAPFQLVGDHGTSATIRAVPVVFTFHIVTGVEDQLLAVQGQFSLMNFTWAPYDAGPDGLQVPMPRGFKGALVAERDQAVAGVSTGVGFVVPRPLPPAGPTIFHGGFSLPVDSSGSVAWSQDLPFDTVQSWMRLVQLPQMSVEVPKGTHGELVQTEEGPVYQITDINIHAAHSMVLAVHGLPTQPAWKVWLPRIIGIVVIGVMFAGILLAVMYGGDKKPKLDPVREARRGKLMDELVDLERAGKEGKEGKEGKDGKDAAKRRESLLAELEKLWDDSAA